MFRRLIGFIMIIISLVGVAISVAGAYFSWQFVDRLALGIDNSLVLVTDSLDNVIETFALAQTSVNDVSLAMETVEQTTVDMAQTMDETRPLIEQSSVVATEQIPQSLTAVQDALPALQEVAGTIDQTLTTLNDFQIDETILGININYDLGVDYNPQVGFDDAVDGIAVSLEGVPESLTALKVYLNVANDNLGVISDDIYMLGDNLSTLNDRVVEIDPLLEEYVRIITDVNDSTRQVRTQVSSGAAQAKTVLLIIFVWFGLTQLAPLYLGYELIVGLRDPDRYVTDEELEEEMAEIQERNDKA